MLPEIWKRHASSATVAMPGPTTVHDESGTRTVMSTASTDGLPSRARSIHGIVPGDNIHVDEKNGAEYAPMTTALPAAVSHCVMPKRFPCGKFCTSSDTTKSIVSSTDSPAARSPTQKVAWFPSYT